MIVKVCDVCGKVIEDDKFPEVLVKTLDHGWSENDGNYNRLDVCYPCSKCILDYINVRRNCLKERS